VHASTGAIVASQILAPFWNVISNLPFLLGGASVLYWHLGERTGHGDLRPYVVIQFLPLLLIPMILLLFPSRLSRVGLLWTMLVAYVVAKLLELADGAIFDLDHLVSGHTLKHLVAGFAMYLFLLAVRHRRPVAAASAPARNTAPAA